MSMISAQIDELRELAGDGSMEWVSGPVRAIVLRDAADTIDRLREERDTYRDLVDCMVHPDIPDQLAAENAKLRKLLAKTFHELQKALTEEYGGWDDDQTLDLMHEITDAGVEVDG